MNFHPLILPTVGLPAVHLSTIDLPFIILSAMGLIMSVLIMYLTAIHLFGRLDIDLVSLTTMNCIDLHIVDALNLITNSLNLADG